MKYRDLILGVLMSVVASVIGSFLFVKFVAGLDYLYGMQFYKSQGLLGKIITLGAVVNLILFFILLKFNKDLMARGVILGMIILTIVTLLI